MRRALAAAAALVALVALPASAAARTRWDTHVLAVVPKPGYPAHAYVHPNGRIYEGTYDNPSGDTVPSRVFEYADDGTLLRSWTMQGQDLSQAHGVQVATSDARGRLVLLDKSPPRALLLDRSTGQQLPYAEFPAGSIPNYAAWGPDGSLYVTDYGKPIVWRVPPGGGTPQPWLQDPRLDGSQFGATGIMLTADRSALLVGMQSEGGGNAGNPTTGRIWRVPIAPGGAPGEMTQLWESRPADGPDGFAIAKSGSIYVALLVSNQIGVIKPDGTEIERFPNTPGSGDNGSSVPFDSPSSVHFLGTRLIVAQQSYFNGDATHMAILDVESGEPGLPELIPFNAGLSDATPPALSRVSLSRAALRFRLSERAEVYVMFQRRKGGRWATMHTSVNPLEPGARVLAVQRISGKDHRLGPGRYRAVVRARDAAGNRSQTIARGLRVRR